MKLEYRSWRPDQKTLELVKMCEAILAELSEYRLTLRQLYYQLVSRDILANTERQYKRLSRALSRARLAGLIDWGAIEDRVRRPTEPLEFQGVSDLIEAAIASYRLPRWLGQSHYVELWVEKDALASVLSPLARKYHVTLMVNRGYSSTSAMFDAAQRFEQHGDSRRVLFYIGDFDPSGEDMVRDIKERLDEFGVGDVIVSKLALTRAQIDKFGPPPNPAKRTDPRSRAFIERHGAASWEVDALPPAALADVIRRAFDGVVDADRMSDVIARESKDIERLRRTVDRIVE